MDDAHQAALHARHNPTTGECLILRSGSPGVGRQGLRLATLALAVLLLLAACTEGAPADPSAVDRQSVVEPRAAIERVVVIVIDATHAAHLGCYGGPEQLTPRIDELAERGVRFERAFSNNTWTLPSTVSLLTGQLQEHHGVITNRHRLGSELPMLPELFQRAGWLTGAFVEMIYGSAVFGLDRGFDDYHYYSIKAGAHPLTMGTAVVGWLEEHRDDRYLLYVHLRRPHSPYDRNPTVQRQLAPGCPLADGSQDELLAHADSKVHDGLEPVQADHVRHLYRGNLGAVDHTVGRLLATLAGDDHALVLLTSDHGEALGQHGHWGHGHSLDAECVDIPLIVAGPGVVQGVDPDPACTVDVMPTLLDLCGVPSPSDLAGRSLAPRLMGEKAGRAPDSGRAGGGAGVSSEDASAALQPMAFSSAYRHQRIALQGVILGDLKLVLDQEGGAQLFDRRADPGDTRDISAEHPGAFARMLSWAESRRDLGATLPLSGVEPFDVNEEQLRALGYTR